ncbi:hypothetical protein CMMCAS08_02625 [Clavibacter michiganensis subsp. michiganensis]|nr:hypothetical protein CMMCAS08_02625 [Clavibacter michiganensis subsp. michiganensis]
MLALRHGEAAIRALVDASAVRVVRALAIPFLRPEGRRDTELALASPLAPRTRCPASPAPSPPSPDAGTAASAPGAAPRGPEQDTST